MTANMLKTLTFRFVSGAFVLCVAELLGSAIAAQARPVDSLLPLRTRTIEATGENVGYEEVADTMNTQIAEEQARLNEPVGLQLESIPIVNELINAAGELDTSFKMGGGVPLSVGVGDVMGNTGVVLSTDFKVY